MFRRATAFLLTVLMLWHGLAMSLLGADVGDVPSVDQQLQNLHAAQPSAPAGDLGDHHMDDQPGQLLQLQAADALLGCWGLNCPESLRHLPPMAPRDDMHPSPWLDGLHRPPNAAPPSARA